MSTKTLEGPAFGSVSARFNLNGVHPNLLTTGRMPYDNKITLTASSRLGPGSYDLLKYSEFSESNVSRRADGPNWEQSLHTEKMAKMPHLLYKESFKKKLEDKRRLGPGYYEISECLQGKPTSNRGMLDTLSPRFGIERFNSNPGPFEYGIPDEKLEEKRKNKPGKVALFERSKEPRSLPTVGCEVPPGTYSLKNSIDELIKKKTSNKGPYEVFSENRSAPIKWGHYAVDVDKNLGPGQYELKSFVDDLNDSSNVKHGKFGKISQYPAFSGDRLSMNNTSLQPRNVDFPGPGAYSPQELSKVTSNPPPFLSSSNRTNKQSQKFFMKNFNPVGVARYDIQKVEESEHKNGHKSIFVSKTSQTAQLKDQKYLSERLKPHNLSHQEKLNLYYSGSVYGQATTA